METDLNMKDKNIFRDSNLELAGEEINMLSPLQLAYIGDAVYELLVRTYILSKRLPVKDLHRAATSLVKAKAQADIVHKLEGLLKEDEVAIVKRGRNAKTASMPKHASLVDYKYATGFEALMGYLYLQGQDLRISELFDQIKELDLD